jgi:phosphohistidine phosphatase
MKLYVFRHGEAEDIGKNGVLIDEARRLTEKGRSDAEKMGAYLKSKNRKANLLIHSPLVRAAQTAEIISAQLGCERKEVKELSTDYGVRTYMEVLKAHQQIDYLALVGHQPTLSKFISTLATGEQHLQIQFEPCSLAILRIAPASMSGELQLVLSPNDI